MIEICKQIHHSTKTYTTIVATIVVNFKNLGNETLWLKPYSIIRFFTYLSATVFRFTENGLQQCNLLIRYS